MNAASNSARTSDTGVDAGIDASMEEILASIRRIIADDQALPLIDRDAEGKPAPAAGTLPSATSGSSGKKTADAGPAAASSDGEFDSWLSETAQRARNDAVSPDPQPQRREPVISFSAEDRLTAAKSEAPDPVSAPADLNAWEDDAADDASTAPENTGNDDWESPAKSARPAAVQPPEDDEWELPKPALAEAASAANEQDGDDRDSDLDRPVGVGAQAGPNLLSGQTSSSVASSFQALTQTVMMQNSGMIEQEIRALLRPMLKQWLDDNLPTMVERLVRAEIERVARGGP